MKSKDTLLHHIASRLQKVGLIRCMLAFVVVALVGCKSTPEKPQGEQAAAEAPVEQTEVESNIKESEAKADAMVASLARKSKFDEEDEEETAEAVVVEAKPVSKPKKATPKPAPVVKKQAVVESKKPSVKVAKVVETKKAEPKPAPVAKKKPAPRSFKALNATRSDLPIEYGVWKIRKGEATLDKDIVITTPTWDMGEEGYLSQIWVTLMDDKLLINSWSEIYAPEGKAGIKIDGGELIPFDRIVEGNIGVIDGEEWIDRLARANQIEMFMGFFPDRVPKSAIFQSSLTLEKLGRVAATYNKLK